MWSKIQSGRYTSSVMMEQTLATWLKLSRQRICKMIVHYDENHVRCEEEANINIKSYYHIMIYWNISKYLCKKININNEKWVLTVISQIANFMGPTWGPPGSCRPQMGPMLAPWTLLSGMFNWQPYGYYIRDASELLDWPMKPGVFFKQVVFDYIWLWNWEYKKNALFSGYIFNSAINSMCKYWS